MISRQVDVVGLGKTYVSAKRLGRLWQNLILSRWNSVMAWLPVETIIRDRQNDYYRILAVGDNAGESSQFIEFMLSAIIDVLNEVMSPL